MSGADGTRASQEAVDDALFERIRAYEGRPTSNASVGKDPVNLPMIRHWCEAMGDTDPAYRGPDAVAPPTMLQAWTMGGLSGHPDRSGAYEELSALLDDAGFTSIVATDCEQEYLRPLRPGDLITFDAVIEAVSPRKTTKLGAGYFITTRMDVRAGGVLAGTHRFRVLKYAPTRQPPSAGESQSVVRQSPSAGESQSAQQFTPVRGSRSVRRSPQAHPSPQARPSPPARRSEEPRQVGRPRTSEKPRQPERDHQRPRRPRPVINRDNAGFWAGVAEHRLLIQSCAGCSTPRFPWLPGCNACGSQEWDTVEASGEGTVYSYVVMHHPPFPAFEPPYAVGLIELAEGVRMVSNVVGVPYDKVRIGMPVRLEFLRVDEDLELPVFRAGGEG